MADRDGVCAVEGVADFDDLGHGQVRRGEVHGGPVGLEPVLPGPEAEDQLMAGVVEAVGGRPEPSVEGSQPLDGVVLVREELVRLTL